jgi:RNA polymerase sigma factor (sigma-70 family)
MNAYRALERGERPLKPRNWLIVIAHNVCRQRFRQTARRPMEVAYDEDVAEALVPNEHAPTAADIQRALGELALNQREALVMRELEGRSYVDIAELLGLSVSAVETLLFRARRALREQLEGTLSCSEAEAALSLQLDGHLDRADAALLRSHLRACETCRLLARRQRAQRKGLRALAVVPVPPGLASLFGGGASGLGVAGVGAAVATKVAAVTVAAVALGGGSYAIVEHETASSHPAAHVAHTGPPAAASSVAVKAATSVRKGSAGSSSLAAHGRSAGHGADAVSTVHIRAVGSTRHGVHASASTSQRAVTPGPAASKHTVTLHSPKRSGRSVKKSASKPARKASRSSRTNVLPLTSRSCGNQTVPDSTQAVTTTPTTAGTIPSSCAKPERHAKGMANQP